MTAGDSLGPSAVSNFWMPAGSNKPWTWWGPGLPSMMLRVHFGGTFLQVAALCPKHEAHLEFGGHCHHCEARDEHAAAVPRGWTVTFPLKRLSPDQARTLAYEIVTFLEDFAGAHCDLLSATIRGHEIAEHLAGLLWALHPWANPYVNVPDLRDASDPLARFQAEQLHRQQLWEEIMVLWPRGLHRVGSRDYHSILDGLIS